jgi:hypothetical protein
MKFMAKVNLDVPEDLHLKVKREKLDREDNGDKGSLKDLYYEVIKIGIETIKSQKANEVQKS